MGQAVVVLKKGEGRTLKAGGMIWEISSASCRQASKLRLRIRKSAQISEITSKNL